MGQQAGGMALMMGGKLIGGFLGGPIGGALGGLAGGIISSFLFNKPAAGAVTDHQLANSSYGRFIPLIYGTARLPGTVIWEADPTKAKQSIGKGSMLGGSGTVKYYQSIAHVFCQSGASLLKMWLDGKLHYDATTTIPDQGKFVARVYSGAEDQLPDPLIAYWVTQNVDPKESCPAYRGVSYIVSQDVPLNNYGGRMPNFIGLWATNVADRIVSVKMVKLASDSDVVFSQPGIYPVAVDWARQTIYRIWSAVDDGGVAAFDMVTGNCYASKNLEQMFAPAAVVPYVAAASFPIGNGAIACCQGGKVYVGAGAWFDGASWHQPEIWTLDPYSLSISVRTPIPFNAVLINDGPYRLLGFTLGSLMGEPVDMVVRIDVVYDGPMIIEPMTGLNSGFLPVHWNGINRKLEVVIGKQDATAGKVELWVLNWSLFDPALGPDKTLYIYKISVYGSDPSGINAMGNFEQMDILHASDFGVTTIPTPWWFAGVVAAYDPSDDTLIITESWIGRADTPTIPERSIKWSPTNGVQWVVADQLIWSNSMTTYYHLDNGLLGNGAGIKYQVARSVDGNISAAIGSPGSDFNFGYDSGLNAMVAASGGDLYVVYLQRKSVSGVRVADILADLCHRAGLLDTEYDVSQVVDTTVGYAITDERTFGTAIMDLCHAFQIDMTESDYKLKFTPRAKPPIVTIPQADLASVDNNDQSHYWQQKRAQEQEMPLQIVVRFQDTELDLQPGSTYAKRTALPVPTVFSKRVKTVELPVAADAATARHIAETWLYTLWAERDTYKTKLGQKYLWLDPTDNFLAAFDNGDLSQVRIEQEEIGADWSMNLDLTSEDHTVYEVSTMPGQLVSYVPATVVRSPYIELLQFNVPLLQDSDDLGGLEMRIYFAGGPTSPVDVDTIATLYQSTDGASWPLYANMVDFADWGHAINGLGSTIAHFSTDYANSLTVTMAPGSKVPASITTLDLMNGVNPVLVGQEIIQFQYATENADGSFTLSVLLRGRRGTEWAIGGHVPGEVVLFLEIGAIQPNRLPLTQLKQLSLWKLVPSGRFLDSSPTESFAYRGYDLMPYAPVNAERTLSGGNLVLTWIRRTRMGGLLVDGTDTAPLNEESEQYEVYLLDSGILASFDPAVPATYRRAFVGLTSPSATYTAAEMAADGFDLTSSILYAVIYQISAVVGRGFPGFHVLPPAGGALSVGLEDGSGVWAGWVWG